MHITFFIGSARKNGHTTEAVNQYVKLLKSKIDFSYEIFNLFDYKIKICQGCKNCFEKGEEKCPLDDDIPKLVEKMNSSDACIFATPNYAFHVSSMMKVFIDRIAYILHRPRFFGKVFSPIVVQGIYGGNKIVKYLNFTFKAMGFIPVKGSVITSLDPVTEKVKKKNDKILEKHITKVYKRLKNKKMPVPPLFEIMIFRLSRSSIYKMLDDSNSDYRYYREMGWFTSDFYYPVKIGLVKKLFGKLFDIIAGSE